MVKGVSSTARAHRRLFLSVMSLFALLPALGFGQGQPGLPVPGVRPLGNGSYDVTAEVWVDHGDYAVDNNHPCSVDHAAEIAALSAAVQKAISLKPELALLASPLVNTLATEAVNFIAHQGGDLGAILVPERSANCSIVAVKIPAGATVEAISYMAGDGDRGVSSCPGQPNQDCAVGWCRFDPAILDGQVVAAQFKNWSNDRARGVSLMWYRPLKAFCLGIVVGRAKAELWTENQD
jgi:hypothetical protein